MMLRRALLVLALSLLCTGPFTEVSAQQAARQPLLMEGRTALFQRVILRPGARVPVDGVLVAGEDSIREVIAFPKNNSGRDVMIDAPSVIDDKQLEELHIRLK